MIEKQNDSHSYRIAHTAPQEYQGGRVVKALDLSSNVRMHTWVRTPFLVWEPGPFFSFLIIFSLTFGLKEKFSFAKSSNSNASLYVNL